MTRKNRSLTDTPRPTPSPDSAFNPGGDDFAMVRMLDGHDPTNIGQEGSNVHVPSLPFHDITDYPVAWDDGFGAEDDD